MVAVPLPWLLFTEQHNIMWKLIFQLNEQLKQIVQECVSGIWKPDSRRKGGYQEETFSIVGLLASLH